MNSLFHRLLKSFSLRIKLIFLAFFALDRHLPISYKDAAMHPKIIGSSNIFKVLFRKKFNNHSPKNSIKKLTRNGTDNPLSIEADVAEFLYDLTRHSKAKIVIEVGIYRGAGSLHFAQAIMENGGGELHLIDISKKYLSDVVKRIQKEKLKIKIQTYLGDSASVVKNSNLPLADLIFIDADHSYEAVKKDCKLYWQKLNVHGYLMIHDTILWEGTRQIANELWNEGYQVVTMATSGGSGISVIKKTKGR